MQRRCAGKSCIKCDFSRCTTEFRRYNNLLILKNRSNAIGLNNFSFLSTFFKMTPRKKICSSELTKFFFPVGTKFLVQFSGFLQA